MKKPVRPTVLGGLLNRKVQAPVPMPKDAEKLGISQDEVRQRLHLMNKQYEDKHHKDYGILKHAGHYWMRLKATPKKSAWFIYRFWPHEVGRRKLNPKYEYRYILRPNCDEHATHVAETASLERAFAHKAGTPAL